METDFTYHQIAYNNSVNKVSDLVNWFPHYRVFRIPESLVQQPKFGPTLPSVNSVTAIQV